jgi:PPOX class probable F420-dependent enzyme
VRLVLPEDARRLFAEATVARLATVSEDGRPHVVPVTFAADGGHIYIAVDAKPKTTRNLRRLRNIRGNPHVAVLADHYDEDWASLWWVRADGRAVIEDDQIARPIALLAARYRQYRDNPPPGPVIDITVERWSGWAAAARLQAGDRGDHLAADDLERRYLPDPGHRADRRLEPHLGERA